MPQPSPVAIALYADRLIDGVSPEPLREVIRVLSPSTP